MGDTYGTYAGDGVFTMMILITILMMILTRMLMMLLLVILMIILMMVGVETSMSIKNQDSRIKAQGSRIRDLVRP